MLSREENELITRVGPGTLMGGLMRQYWLPALLSSELPTADSDPVRVLLLGEKLIAFRDTNGQIGLLDQHCPHRGASLYLGRNEESGLRCVYHGWKFDTSGQCIDMPNPRSAALRGAREPAESDFRTKVKATAYPTHERNGVVWAYLGPRATPPPLPSLEGNMLPEGTWSATAVQRECNWLQALEGDIDTSHFSFLHAGSLQAATSPKARSRITCSATARRAIRCSTPITARCTAPTATPTTIGATGVSPSSCSRATRCRRRACSATK